MLLNENDLKAAIPLAENFTYENVKPDIDVVAVRIIKNLLGTTLYDELVADYAGESTDSAQNELLTYVQPVIGNLAVYAYMPKGNVIINNNGILVTHTNDQKPALEWQIRDIRDSLMSGGYSAIESLIQFLEENTGVYAWNTAVARSLIVNTAAEVQQFVNINNSRLMYLALVPIMQRYQEDEIKGNISDELYEEIEAEILADGEPSATNLLLMRNLQGAIVHLSYADLILEKSLLNDGDGFHLINSSLSGSLKSTIPAEESRLRVRRDHHEQIGRKYLQKLVTYLHTNADTYPLYKNSDLYVEDARATDNVTQSADHYTYPLGL